MAWIETIPEDKWEGELRELYPKVSDLAQDRVDNIMQIHSLNHRALAAHHNLYTSAMSGTPGLRKVDREMIALVVSGINECHY
jgi:alkylhydroperoxidase family enzyme